MKKLSLEAREYLSLGEEIANAISHGVGAIFGIVALVLLISKANTTEELTGAIFFGIGITSLYLMSTLCHSFKKGTMVKHVFERLDHVFIYILIGGTFTPFLLTLLPSPWNWTIMGLLWVVIITGVTIKAWKFDAYHFLHVTAYLLIGWSALGFIRQLYAHSLTGLVLVALGGVAYSVGVYFYANRKMRYSHFIWHLFVLMGTTLHFISVYGYLY